MLLMSPEGAIGLGIGFALLAHVGYTALTSLPLGAIPGRPDGAKKERRNQELRSSVIGFLNEVRHVESQAQRAKFAGRTEHELEAYLRSAEGRMMAAAAEVVRVTGRATPDPTVPGVTGVGTWD